MESQGITKVIEIRPEGEMKGLHRIPGQSIQQLMRRITQNHGQPHWKSQEIIIISELSTSGCHERLYQISLQLIKLWFKYFSGGPTD